MLCPRSSAVSTAVYLLLPLALDVAHGDIGAVAQQHIDPDALPVAEPVAGTLHLDQARTRWRGVLRYGRGGEV